MYYAMLRLWKGMEKRLLNDNQGSMSIPLLLGCLVLWITISILYVMGHNINKSIAETTISNELKSVNEFYLTSANNVLLSKNNVNELFLLDNKVYKIKSVQENDLTCDIQGIKNGDTIILMGESKRKNFVSRIYVELCKQGDNYVPKYWNY